MSTFFFQIRAMLLLLEFFFLVWGHMTCFLSPMYLAHLFIVWLYILLFFSSRSSYSSCYIFNLVYYHGRFQIFIRWHDFNSFTFIIKKENLFMINLCNILMKLWGRTNLLLPSFIILYIGLDLLLSILSKGTWSIRVETTLGSSSCFYL